MVMDFTRCGNVWEWCYDWYRPDYYPKAPTSNPPGPSSGFDLESQLYLSVLVEEGPTFAAMNTA